ncbi:MAG: hypothetical protein WKF37_13840 [Bryobacteraceae bacterium]
MGQGDPRPSGGFKEVRTQAFTVGHPQNWETFGDQGGAMLTIAPRSGLVQDRNGGVAVGYGAMLSFYTPQNQGTLAQETQGLISQLRQANQAMQSGGRQQRTKIDNSNALVTTLYNQSPLGGGREVDMLVTVERPEGLFYMVFIAPEGDFQNLQGTFEQMLRSVRFSNR